MLNTSISTSGLRRLKLIVYVQYFECVIDFKWD